MRRLVAAVIYRKKDNKFLILRRRLNWKGWECVKGEVGKETLKQAALRETREETGIRKASIICRLPAEIIYHHEKIRGHTTSIQKAFLVEYLGGGIRLSCEHSGYTWADGKTAAKLLTHTTHKTFLRLANGCIKEEKKKLIDKLSKKHVSLVRYDGEYISLKYDNKKLKCRAVKRTVRVVGDWSRKKNIVYYDKNLKAPGVIPILIHEVVEKHAAQKYGLDVDTEAHKVATAVEKEFIADKHWIRQAKMVSLAWVKANKQKIGKSRFY